MLDLFRKMCEKSLLLKLIEMFEEYKKCRNIFLILDYKNLFFQVFFRFFKLIFLISSGGTKSIVCTTMYVFSFASTHNEYEKKCSYVYVHTVFFVPNCDSAMFCVLYQ